jgi:hypothetical protein
MEATRFYQHAREQPPPKIALLQQQPLARVLDELSAGLAKSSCKLGQRPLGNPHRQRQLQPEILKYIAPLREECVTGQNAQVYCVARSKARAGWR